MGFLREYVKQPATIGAIAPSSKQLAGKMIQPIQFQNCRGIVEYGPGTGVFTDEIVLRKEEDTIFLVIEQNQQFYKDLKERYAHRKNVYVIHGDAADINLYAAQYHMPEVNYVVSGLPFTSLPKEVSTKIFRETQRALGQKGRFIIFQYTLLKKKLFLQWFHLEQTLFEIRNLPSAFVLVMRNR